MSVHGGAPAVNDINNVDVNSRIFLKKNYIVVSFLEHFLKHWAATIGIKAYVHDISFSLLHNFPLRHQKKKLPLLT